MQKVNEIAQSTQNLEELISKIQSTNSILTSFYDSADILEYSEKLTLGWLTSDLTDNSTITERDNQFNFILQLQKFLVSIRKDADDPILYLKIYAQYFERWTIKDFCKDCKYIAKAFCHSAEANDYNNRTYVLGYLDLAHSFILKAHKIHTKNLVE